jgi:hypothetical protein
VLGNRSAGAFGRKMPWVEGHNRQGEGSAERAHRGATAVGVRRSEVAWGAGQNNGLAEAADVVLVVPRAVASEGGEVFRRRGGRPPRRHSRTKGRLSKALLL